MNREKIVIGIPNMGFIRSETTLSILKSIKHLTKYTIDFCFMQGTYLQEVRNYIFRYAVDSKADYLMFIDSDVTFTEKGIKQLLDSKKDLIGGEYLMKTITRQSTIKIANDKGELIATNFDRNKPLIVHAIPTGFMLIKLEKVKHLKNPFDFQRLENGDLVGEDIFFCRLCHTLNIDVWCDPTINMKHIGSYAY